MSDATKHLDRRHLPLSKFEIHVVYRADIKQQAGDRLLRLQTKNRNKTVLDEEVPFLAIYTKRFTTREDPELKENKREDDIVEAKNRFTSFLPKFFPLAYPILVSELEVQNLFEFNLAQTLNL